MNNRRAGFIAKTDPWSCARLPVCMRRNNLKGTSYRKHMAERLRAGENIHGAAGSETKAPPLK